MQAEGGNGMKTGRVFTIVLLSVLAALALFVLGCCIAFGPRYMGRYIFWNLSDIKDHERFPYHEVQNAPPAFHFNQNPQEDRIRSACAGIEYTYKGTPRRIGDLEQFLEATGTTAFIIIKDDAILYERYFNQYSRDSINTSFSMAKSFTSALIGIAIDEGHIESVDDPLTKYIPELRDKGLDAVTIRNLLMMSSVIKYSESKLPGDIDFPWGSNPLTYYHPDLRKIALRVEPDEPPGTHFHYNNYHPLLLGMILERATKKSVAAYLQEKIWEPLEMEYPASWSIDSEESGFEKMESGINARSIDFAKMGRLFLNRGDWDGNRIISEQWVGESTTRDPATPPGYYSLPGWWTPFFQSGTGYYKYMWWGYFREGGDDDFFANGHLGQFIYVSPQKDLIIVRNGKRDGKVDSWSELLYRMADRL